jgi:hypothetical protein
MGLAMQLEFQQLGKSGTFKQTGRFRRGNREVTRLAIRGARLARQRPMASSSLFILHFI